MIEARGLDEKAGLDVTFKQKPAGTARTDFASGTDKVAGSGTLLADVALVNEEGVDTVYVFNVFDFWGAVVTPEDSGISSLSDLDGADVGAALPTANFAMFAGALKAEGVEQDDLNLQNADTPGLGPLAQSGRVDAVQMWEPAYSLLTSKKDAAFDTLDIADSWRESTGADTLPYLGVAAHRDWLEKNPETIQAVYEMYKSAADFVNKNPAEAAEIISEESGVDASVLEDLIKSDRLALHVAPADQDTKSTELLLQQAVDTGYLKSLPDLDEVLYRGLKE
ncbi:MAG: ABC transporter substrate-binding protein [Nocardioidaceae bacterium]